MGHWIVAGKFSRQQRIDLMVSGVFVDRRTKLYSSAVFSWKCGSFHCKILFFFFCIFGIFRGLFELDLLL